MKCDDDWWRGMLELQTQVSQRYADEVARLRKENKQLRQELESTPAHATELQDRATMLEGLLRRLNVTKA